MLGFAAPGALTALAAIAVPIALHLWSRRTGAPLRIGSIALFAAAPPPATRRPRIEDFWLLVLRCAVIAALALALAGPYWRSAGSLPSGAVWALVAPEAATDPRNQPLLDSLRAAGADIQTLPAGPIWSALREADYVAPSGTRFVVVAPDRGALGDRPTLRSEVQWIVKEGRQGDDVEEQGALRRHVIVYSDASRREDARYVAAAFKAAAEATRRPAVVTQRDAAASGRPDSDWMVWLAARPIPEALLERVRGGATLLTDALADEPRDVSAHLRLAAATDPDRAAPLLRRRTDIALAGAPVWADDAGRPVLTLARVGTGQWLRFHSRFHPSWSDLVLHPAFAEAMAALWAGADARAPEPLEQRVAPSQLVPARDSTQTGTAPTRSDLYHAFWLAGLLLFLIERLLARRSREVVA